MVTGFQIRAARAALRWSASDLAAAAGISARTIARLEDGDGVPRSQTSKLRAVEAALERAGIEFVGTPDDGPGIRVRPRP